MRTKHCSISSTDDSSSLKDTELDSTQLSLKNKRYSTHAYKQPINRYLSHSSAIINDPQPRMIQNQIDQRDTYTLPRPLRSKERRLTLNSIHQPTTESLPPRDTDSSSTQDSGYSDSTPFFLVQQVTPEKEHVSLYPIIHSSQVSFQGWNMSVIIQARRVVLLMNIYM